MEPQHTGEETEQQRVFIEEQAKYWKAFVHDLFLGTLKRMVVSPFVFGITFLVVAYLIYKFSIKTQDVFALLKILEALLIFILYLLVGILSGLLHGANTTLLKKVEDLEQGVHLIVDPLMTMVIEKMPGGQKGISIEEFNVPPG